MTTVQTNRIYYLALRLFSTFDVTFVQIYGKKIVTVVNKSSSSWWRKTNGYHTTVFCVGTYLETASFGWDKKALYK